MHKQYTMRYISFTNQHFWQISSNQFDILCR